MSRQLAVAIANGAMRVFLLAFLAGLMLGGCALVEQGRWKSGGHGQIRCHGARC
jgi:uncharacterized protein YceK